MDLPCDNKLQLGSSFPRCDRSVLALIRWSWARLGGNIATLHRRASSVVDDILVGGLEYSLFSHILGIIIPIELMFCRGVETTNQYLMALRLFENSESLTVRNRSMMMSYELHALLQLLVEMILPNISIPHRCFKCCKPRAQNIQDCCDSSECHGCKLYQLCSTETFDLCHTVPLCSLLSN